MRSAGLASLQWPRRLARTRPYAPLPRLGQLGTLWLLVACSPFAMLGSNESLAQATRRNSAAPMGTPAAKPTSRSKAQLEMSRQSQHLT